ncbi:MAG: sigma-70 family RNA polymerase sigma factor [Gammaproteobacteria bacterium]|jgi:RNA polymerase sigma-70 factor (ECF subfamily)|nr:sigma-70 family RNA polymerase sigma factor [Gammaproteobacteria bacterium]
MHINDLKAFFSTGVEQNIDALYSVALRLTRKNVDAEDLVAETVAKAWGAIDTLNDQDRFRPWLFRILHNVFVSDYRKMTIRPVEASFDQGDDSDDELASLLNEQSDDFLVWWSNPERAYFNDLLGDQLLDAIDNLPEAFRSVVVLVNVEGFTYDETAEVLGIAPGTVRSRMKRGRTLLQKSLWEQRPGSQENTSHET